MVPSPASARFMTLPNTSMTPCPMPNATYLGFTGAPIEKTEVSIPAVFGSYVNSYDEGSIFQFNRIEVSLTHGPSVQVAEC